MPRLSCLLAVALVLAAGGAARAQDPPAAPDGPPPAPLVARPEGVAVTTLAAPDAFTTPGRDTGLPATLWRGASAQTAKTVLPLLAAKPLSPAAAALARRVLATGAPGPRGASDDPALAAARANALMFQGDPKAAAAVLARAPGVDRNADLARAAAESLLLSGDDKRACQLAEALSVGRDETYWLKLRTYCQAIAGQMAQAQLTFDLVQAQVKDPTFARLMGAKLAGVGNPGAASLRNGLDYALSRSLGLDLATAKPSPAVAAALAGADPAPPVLDASAAAPDVSPLAEALARGEPIRDAAMAALVDAAASTEPKARARGQAALLLALAVSGASTPEARGLMAGLSVPEGKAPLGRDLALEAAGAQKLMGEAALLSLWTCAEAGAAGPSIGDRVRIVRALHAVGLDADARAIALEGLLALK
jgi:hypothetical protein